MANAKSLDNDVHFLSFLEPEAEKEIISTLNIDSDHFIRGHDYLASYQPDKIKKKVVVFMPKQKDFVARTLLKVIRITRKRKALVFFDGLPNIDLGQAMHFEEILVWPCEEQLRALVSFERDVTH